MFFPFLEVFKLERFDKGVGIQMLFNSHTLIEDLILIADTNGFRVIYNFE